MWQKIKCWLGLEPNTYLVSYQFQNIKGSGFGRYVQKANKFNRETMEFFVREIKTDVGDDCNIVILNVVRLDND